MSVRVLSGEDAAVSKSFCRSAALSAVSKKMPSAAVAINRFIFLLFSFEFVRMPNGGRESKRTVQGRSSFLLAAQKIGLQKCPKTAFSWRGEWNPPQKEVKCRKTAKFCVLGGGGDFRIFFALLFHVEQYSSRVCDIHYIKE